MSYPSKLTGKLVRAWQKHTLLFMNGLIARICALSYTNFVCAVARAMCPFMGGVYASTRGLFQLHLGS